jgi:hypothetical protein
LDLHYLLTAYGTQNYEAEALLGHAVHTLHRTPVLSRSHIQDALNALNPSLTGNTGLNNALESAGLADQVEMLKVTPATLGREEMAWLWTALKADYRPTFPFQVTVVLIQARNPTVSALPVLQRAIAAQPNLLSPLPTLTAVTPPNNQPAASPGDVVIVTGVNLSGVTGILLANSRLGINPSLASYSLGGDSFQFTLPKPATMPPSDIPAGVYLLSAQVPTANGVTTTNSLPFAVAPTITTWPTTSITRDTHGNALVPITCAPSLRPGQEAYLLIGGQSSAAATITASTNSPTFNFIALQPTPTGQPAYVRLRVDGVDSPIIDLTKTPPVFFGPTVTVT